MTRQECFDPGTSLRKGGGTVVRRMMIWCFVLSGIMATMPGSVLSADAVLGPKQYWQKGTAYADNKLYIDAVEYYTRAIRTNKGEIPMEDVARIFIGRGMAFLGLNAQDRAIDDFSNALELDDKNQEAALSRGGVYLDRKQYERAKDDFSMVIKLNPRSTAAYAGRSRAFQDEGDHDRAIADLTKLLELEPRNVGALYSMGISYKAKHQDEKALDTFDKVLKIDPDNAAASFQKAGIYARTKKIDAACVWLDVAVADGYRDWGALKNDPDFDSIRKVDCYRKTMAGK
jgi:tetratricopeptide (TPR) repeat protein